MAHDATIYRLVSDSGSEIAPHIEVADTLGSRTMGLMFKKGLEPGHGIVLRPCSSIHMFFMRFAIDVVFVDKDGIVKHICHAIKPWRMSRIVFGAKAAIELEPGTMKRAGVEKGRKVELVPVA